MSDFADDLDVFFADFGVPVTVNTTPPRTFTAIRSTATEAVSLYDGTVEAGADILTCKTTDAAGLTSVNRVTVAGRQYRVGQIRDRGAGTTEIHLGR